MVFIALLYFSGWLGEWVAGLVENIATSAPTKAGVWAGAELRSVGGVFALVGPSIKIF